MCLPRIAPKGEGHQGRLLEGGDGDYAGGDDHERYEPQRTDDEEENVLVGQEAIPREREEQSKGEPDERGEQGEGEELEHQVGREHTAPGAEEIAHRSEEDTGGFGQVHFVTFPRSRSETNWGGVFYPGAPASGHGARHMEEQRAAD